MPTPQQVRNEITADPLGLGYATPLAVAADGTTAGLLNAKQYRGPVPIIDLSAYCTVNGISGKVEAAAYDPTSPLAVRQLCFGVLAILRNDLRLNTADVDDPSSAAMTGGLIDTGLMTEAQRDVILTLANNRRSRAEVLWGAGASVDANLVGQARNLGA